MCSRIIIFPWKDGCYKENGLLQIFLVKPHSYLFSRIFKQLIMLIVKEQVSVLCITCIYCPIACIGVIDMFYNLIHIIDVLFG